MDIALQFTETVENLEPLVDLVIENGDLKLDNGFETAVIVSLLTDRLANQDDAIPDGTTNRRDWWGNASLDATAVQPNRYLIGSRLWLLSREKQTVTTLNNAIAYAQEALQWMLDLGVAQEVDVTGDFGAPARLATIVLHVNMVKKLLSGPAVNKSFDVAWAATIAGLRG